MSLSVLYSKSGNGLAHLLKQTRPAKAADDTAPTAPEQTAATPPRAIARSVIDSTGSGTAQISAALTIYMSKLGTPDNAPESNRQDSRVRASEDPTATHDDTADASAATLLRTLDAYGSWETPAFNRMTA